MNAPLRPSRGQALEQCLKTSIFILAGLLARDGCSCKLTRKMDSGSPNTPIDEVQDAFENGGHAVHETTGAQPGEVWRFATPREGFFRPKTYWTIWDSVPADLQAALRALDLTREVAGAERALAVVA